MTGRPQASCLPAALGGRDGVNCPLCASCGLPTEMGRERPGHRGSPRAMPYAPSSHLAVMTAAMGTAQSSMLQYPAPHGRPLHPMGTAQSSCAQSPGLYFPRSRLCCRRPRLKAKGSAPPPPGQCPSTPVGQCPSNPTGQCPFTLTGQCPSTPRVVLLHPPW